MLLNLIVQYLFEQSPSPTLFCLVKYACKMFTHVSVYPWMSVPSRDAYRVLQSLHFSFMFLVPLLQDADGTFAVVVRASNTALPAQHPRVAHFRDLLHFGASQGYPPYDLGITSSDDAIAIMYTSGTTGNPKGVVQTHRNICDQMMMGDLGGRISAATSTGPGSGVSAAAQTAIICPVPLFHVTGSHHIFIACFPEGGSWDLYRKRVWCACGAVVSRGCAWFVITHDCLIVSCASHTGRKLCLMRKWDAGEALRLIETERVTGWTAVPTMLQDMIQVPVGLQRWG